MRFLMIAVIKINCKLRIMSKDAKRMELLLCVDPHSLPGRVYCLQGDGRART